METNASKSLIRYVYAIGTGTWSPYQRRGWIRREIPAEMVSASTALTDAARDAVGRAKPPTFQASFSGLSDVDVASIFAAAKRREVWLQGSRFTREPTLWGMEKKR